MISSAALSSAENIPQAYYNNHHDEDDDDDHDDDQDDYNNNHDNHNDNVETTILPSSSSPSFLSRLFRSCSDDPKGSVHRTWSVCLLCLLLYIVFAIVQLFLLLRNNRRYGTSSSRASLILGSIWTVISHLNVAIFGTFVLKRFATAFAIGMFLSLLLVMGNQNLILCAIFHQAQYQRKHRTYFSSRLDHENKMFGTLCFLMAIMLFFFMTLVHHFRSELAVTPAKVKGVRGGSKSLPANSSSSSSSSPKEDYDGTDVLIQ